MYYVLIPPPVGGCGRLSICFGRRLGKRPFSYTKNKPGCCGGLAVLAVQVGVILLKGLGIKAAAVHVAPRCLPAVTL